VVHSDASPRTIFHWMSPVGRSSLAVRSVPGTARVLGHLQRVGAEADLHVIVDALRDELEVIALS
jgi:hypothetical protein